MQTFKKIATVAASVILWAIILLAAVFAFTALATKDKNRVANLAGYTPMTVQTDSMSPTFNSGDLILIKQCDPATLEVGDIITFHTIIMNEYALNTHRIAAIDDENGVRIYTTKGDNNAISDTHEIADGDIVGIYVGRVEHLGSVLDFMSSSVGFLLIIVLPMLAFFIYQVYHLVIVSINLKKAIAVENAVEAQKAADAAKMAADAQKQASAADDEARRMKEEAEAALAEARRMKEEAEAALAKAKSEAAGAAPAASEAAASAEVSSAATSAPASGPQDSSDGKAAKDTKTDK